MVLARQICQACDVSLLVDTTSVYEINRIFTRQIERIRHVSERHLQVASVFKDIDREINAYARVFLGEL